MSNNILSQVPSISKIKRELKKVIFGKFLFCPKCGSRQIKPIENRYRCQICRRKFSLISVTWLKGMKLPLDTFWLLLWCWINEVSLKQTMKLCGISKPTIRNWYQKFRENLPHMDDVVLSGIIQMDEAYRGGKKKGYSIIGAKEEKQANKKSNLALAVINKSSVDRRDVISFLTQRVEPDSKLQTDGSSIYKGIAHWWRVHHEYERHNKWEFALTSEIEGVWENLTKFIRKMYDHVTRSHIEDIIREFTIRKSHPEWFATAYSYVRIGFQKIERPRQKEWRGQYQKKRLKINTLKSRNYSIISLPTELSTVPS